MIRIAGLAGVFCLVVASCGGSTRSSTPPGPPPLPERRALVTAAVWAAIPEHAVAAIVVPDLAGLAAATGPAALDAGAATVLREAIAGRLAGSGVFAREDASPGSPAGQAAIDPWDAAALTALGIARDRPAAAALLPRGVLALVVPLAEPDRLPTLASGYVHAGHAVLIVGLSAPLDTEPGALRGRGLAARSGLRRAAAALRYAPDALVYVDVAGFAADVGRRIDETREAIAARAPARRIAALEGMRQDDPDGVRAELPALRALRARDRRLARLRRLVDDLARPVDALVLGIGFDDAGATIAASLALADTPRAWRGPGARPLPLPAVASGLSVVVPPAVAGELARALAGTRATRALLAGAGLDFRLHVEPHLDGALALGAGPDGERVVELGVRDARALRALGAAPLTAALIDTGGRARLRLTGESAPAGTATGARARFDARLAASWWALADVDAARLARRDVVELDSGLADRLAELRAFEAERLRLAAAALAELGIVEVVDARLDGDVAGARARWQPRGGPRAALTAVARAHYQLTASEDGERFAVAEDLAVWHADDAGLLDEVARAWISPGADYGLWWCLDGCHAPLGDQVVDAPAGVEVLLGDRDARALGGPSVAGGVLGAATSRGPALPAPSATPGAADGAPAPARQVVVTASPSNIEGTVDANLVRQRVFATVAPVTRCFEALLARQPDAHGFLEVAFTVTESGATAGIGARPGAEATGLDGAAFRACVEGAFASLDFGSRAGYGEARVRATVWLRRVDRGSSNE